MRGSKGLEISMTKWQMDKARELWGVEGVSFACGHLLDILTAIQQGYVRRKRKWCFPQQLREGDVYRGPEEYVPRPVGIRSDVCNAPSSAKALICTKCIEKRTGWRVYKRKKVEEQAEFLAALQKEKITLTDWPSEPRRGKRRGNLRGQPTLEVQRPV